MIVATVGDEPRRFGWVILLLSSFNEVCFTRLNHCFCEWSLEALLKVQQLFLVTQKRSYSLTKGSVSVGIISIMSSHTQNKNLSLSKAKTKTFTAQLMLCKAHQFITPYFSDVFNEANDTQQVDIHWQLWLQTLLFPWVKHIKTRENKVQSDNIWSGISPMLTDWKCNGVNIL